MENNEERENSFTFSLPEFAHWHLRDSLRVNDSHEDSQLVIWPFVEHFLDSQQGHPAQDQNYLRRFFSPHNLSPLLLTFWLESQLEFSILYVLTGLNTTFNVGI
jgi:hypothetical protein